MHRDVPRIVCFVLMAAATGAAAQHWPDNGPSLRGISDSYLEQALIRLDWVADPDCLNDPDHQVYFDDDGNLMVDCAPAGHTRQPVTGTLLVNKAFAGPYRGRYAEYLIEDARPHLGTTRFEYKISVAFADGLHIPLCDKSDSSEYAFAVPFVPANGQVDDNAAYFVFACTPKQAKDGQGIARNVSGGGAIAKCIDLGYRPPPSRGPASPAMPKADRAQLDLYGACLDMLTADYCGDGHRNTFSGTQIDVLDRNDALVIGPDKASQIPKSSSPGMLGFAALGPGEWKVPLEKYKGLLSRWPGRKNIRKAGQPPLFAESTEDCDFVASGGHLQPTDQCPQLEAAWGVDQADHRIKALCISNERWRSISTEGRCFAGHQPPPPCNQGEDHQYWIAKGAVFFSYAPFNDAMLVTFRNKNDGRYLTTTRATRPSTVPVFAEKYQLDCSGDSKICSDLETDPSQWEQYSIIGPIASAPFNGNDLELRRYYLPQRHEMITTTDAGLRAMKVKDGEVRGSEGEGYVHGIVDLNPEGVDKSRCRDKNLRMLRLEVEQGSANGQLRHILSGHTADGQSRRLVKRIGCIPDIGLPDDVPIEAPGLSQRQALDHASPHRAAAAPARRPGLGRAPGTAGGRPVPGAGPRHPGP